MNEGTTTSRASDSSSSPTTVVAPTTTLPPEVEYLGAVQDFLDTLTPPTTAAPPGAGSVAYYVALHPCLGASGCAADYTPDEIGAILDSAAAEFAVDAVVLREIARCESGFNDNAINSSSRALGLGQHLPRFWVDRATAIGYPATADPFDPVVNARVTAWLLATDGTSPWAPWSGHCSTAY